MQPSKQQNVTTTTKDQPSPTTNSTKNKNQNSPISQCKDKCSSPKSEQQSTPKTLKKRVIILIPLTIPATGKSTLFNTIKQKLIGYHVQILSCDEVRAQKMERVLQKQTDLSKHEAEQKVTAAANKKYYKMLAQHLKDIEINNYNDTILFMDRNHTSESFRQPLEQIKINSERCKNLDIKVACILPKFQQSMKLKGKFEYPFSQCYLASCLKKMVNRKEHHTLEGKQIQRVNICLNFANMFRNVNFNNQYLSEHFDKAIQIPFHNEQEVPSSLANQIHQIMAKLQPGIYSDHPEMEELVEELKEWENLKQLYVEIDMREIQETIDNLFENFDSKQLIVKAEKREEQVSI